MAGQLPLHEAPLLLRPHAKSAAANRLSIRVLKSCPEKTVRTQPAETVGCSQHKAAKGRVIDRARRLIKPDITQCTWPWSPPWPWRVVSRVQTRYQCRPGRGTAGEGTLPCCYNPALPAPGGKTRGMQEQGGAHLTGMVEREGEGKLVLVEGRHLQRWTSNERERRISLQSVRGTHPVLFPVLWPKRLGDSASGLPAPRSRKPSQSRHKRQECAAQCITLCLHRPA